MPVGALAHFGYAEESAAAPGTLVAITKFFDPTSADIDDQFPRKAVPTLREDRSQVRSVSEITEVKGSWSSPLYYNALPFFLKMALGDVVSIAGTAAVAAVLTTDLVGNNNDLTFTAKAAGIAGNSITVTYVVAGVSTSLTVGVVANAITVNVATSAGSAATSTANQVKAAINASGPASALITATNAPGDSGAGVVTAMVSNSLENGAAATGGGAAIVHTFSGTKRLPTFSTEVAYDTAGAKQASGCKVDKLTINAKAGEAAEVDCDFLGIATSKNAAAVVTGLPADDNIAVFSHATVTFDGVPNVDVMSIELGIENSLEGIKTLNGTSFVQRIAEGVRKITCGLEMDFQNQDMYTMSINATKVAVVLNFTSTVEIETGKYYEIEITLPNVKFSAVSSPVEADGIISQKVEAVPLYDGTAGYDISVVVTNTDAAYADVA
jgi:hypothetical protein